MLGCLAGCGEATIDHARGCPELDEVYVAESEDPVTDLESLRGFTHVLGDVEVGGGSIEALECLEVVRGELYLPGDTLVDEELPRLRQVGILRIGFDLETEEGDSESLTSLQGLPSLESIGEGLQLLGLPSLRDLTALDDVLFDGFLFVGGLSSEGELSMTVPRRLEGDLLLWGPIPDVRAVTRGIRSIAGAVWIEQEAVGQVDLPALEAIEGSLRIVGDGAGPLPDFANLRTVQDGVYVESTATQDLSEFTSLRTTPSLEIYRCPQLLSLDGLASLESFDQPEESLDGSEPFRHIILEGNPALTSIAALANVEVESSEGPSLDSITLTDDASLSSLEGLGSLLETTTFVKLADLPSLRDFAGLEQTGVVRTMTIERTGLRSLQGLDPRVLRRLDSLTLRNNVEFEDLSALFAAAKGDVLGSVEEIRLERLPKLPRCRADELAEAFDERGDAGVVSILNVGDEAVCAM